MSKHKKQNDAPCRDCEDRFPGCHDACPTYRTWRLMFDEQNLKLREDWEINGCTKEGCIKTMHRKHMERR